VPRQKEQDDKFNTALRAFQIYTVPAVARDPDYQVHSALHTAGAMPVNVDALYRRFFCLALAYSTRQLLSTSTTVATRVAGA
jgi:hypothetical protein